MVRSTPLYGFEPGCAVTIGGERRRISAAHGRRGPRGGHAVARIDGDPVVLLSASAPTYARFAPRVSVITLADSPDPGPTLSQLARATTTERDGQLMLIDPKSAGAWQVADQYDATPAALGLIAAERARYRRALLISAIVGAIALTGRILGAW